MIELIIKVLVAYLLGSLLVGSLLLGKLRGFDIRTMGSGNAGATNMLRTQGKVAALAVLLIDFGKGWLATGVLAPLALPGVPPGEIATRAMLIAACGLAVIVGHVYPVWYGFRGGKGFATLIGTVLGINVTLVLLMLGTWIVVVVIFGFVGLASMAGAGAVAAALAMQGESPRGLLVFAILAALLIIYTHRANIARMVEGSESRARRLWLFGLRREKRG